MMLLKGNKATILTSGEKLNGQWTLVELATIDATHNPETFTKTAYYPEDKNGKTLDGAAAVGLIAKIIDEKETLGEIYQSSLCCQRIMSILIEQKIITELDAPQFITDNGLTAAGKDFIETFLIASVVTEDNLRRLTLDGGKCIRQKIVRASIDLACNGACVDYSIYKEFNAALDIALCAALDKNVRTIDCYIKQKSMFDGSTTNPIINALAYKFELTQNLFKDFFSKLCDELDDADSGQVDLITGKSMSRCLTYRQML